MRAIFSDVHGNLEALQAVLADLTRQRVTSVYNLGDTTGRGPNPIECLDLARGMEAVLLGNFDHGILVDPNCCPGAVQCMLWNRSVLASSDEASAVRERRVAFLSGLSPSHREGDVLYVHGEPRRPLRGYVFPEDVLNEGKMSEIGAAFDRVCFTGNTGVPCVFVERGPGRWECSGAEACVSGFRVAGRRVLCNVGAVGWPRDGDRRACYALFDGETIWFRRVGYEVETTIRKTAALRREADPFSYALRRGV